MVAVLVFRLHGVSEVRCGLCFMYLSRKDARIGDMLRLLSLVLFIPWQLVVNL